MTTGLPRMRRALARAIVLGALCGPAASLSVLAAEAPKTGAPPNLDLSAPGVAWAGFAAPKQPDYAIARLFNDYANPATGLGPVTDGPAHPYVNNEVAREMRTAANRRRRIALRRVKFAEMSGYFALPLSPPRADRYNAKAINATKADKFHWFHLRRTLSCGIFRGMSPGDQLLGPPRPGNKYLILLEYFRRACPNPRLSAQYRPMASARRLARRTSNQGHCTAMS